MSESVTMRSAVPTRGTLDESMLRFINNVQDYVPKEIMQRFYGVCNKTVGLGKFTPRQAEAFILGAEQLVDQCVMSMPSWAVTNDFLLLVENMLQIVKMQVWRATTLDTRNERAHVSESATFSENTAPAPSVVLAPRKKRFGLF